MTIPRLLFMVVLWSCQVLIQAEPPASPALAPLLPWEKVLAESKEVTAEAYPDAKTVLVDEHIRTRYNPDGTNTTLDEDVIKVLTEAGRKEMLQRQFSYNIFYGTFKVHLLEIHKADGRVIKLDPAAQTSEMTDRSQMDANIFDPNDKNVLVSLPGLEVGDTIRTLIERVQTKPRMVNTFSDWLTLESATPLRKLTFELFAPKDLPIKTQALLSEVTGTVKHETSEKDGITRHLWTASNVPQMFEEPKMPEYYTVGQRLLLSTIGSWQEVSQWYWKLSESHLAKITPDMKAQALKLTEKATTQDEKIRAIFRFVSQEIRYMGITTEKEAPGYEPHDVDITYQNRYGVCRDKAALLVALLRAAEVPAYPVLINSGPKKDPEVPNSYFNHAIVAVENAARASDPQAHPYILMDPTDENTADLMPQYLNDCSYLVARPEGETLLVSPIDPAEKNLVLIKTEATLSEKGDITGQVELKCQGYNDNAYRGWLANMKPDDWQRQFEARLKRVLPGASLTRYTVTPEKILDTTQPLTLTWHFTAPSLLVLGQAEAQLALPWFGAKFGVVNSILRDGSGLEKRRFPLQTDIPCGVREDLVLHLPESLQKPLAMPAYETVQTPELTSVQHVKLERNTLVGALDLRMHVTQVAPHQYATLRESLSKLEVNGRQTPVFHFDNPLKTTATSADVRILSQKAHYQVENAFQYTVTETVKKEILTYAGKKENSELRLDYNPVWSKVEIVAAQVTQKDGVVKKIEPQEMNLMDAEWAAGAPRYPAAKTLVVSLPGVEEGAVVEYTVKTSCQARPFFSLAEVFSSFDPSEVCELTLDAPKSLGLRVDAKQLNDAKVTTQDAGDRILTTIVMEKLPALPKETSQPPLSIDQPEFRASSTSWHEYALDLNARVERLVDCQPAIEDKARELLKEINMEKNADSAILALRDYVAMQIREAGPRFSELPVDKAFSPADVTLREGYGHQADRALLLTGLLQCSGFKPEIVLVASRSRRVGELDIPEKSLPQLHWLDRLVVRLPKPGHPPGEWIYFDELSQYAPLGATGLDHGLGLLLKSGEWVELNAPAGYADGESKNLVIALDAEGTATITAESRFHGMNHEEFARVYQEMTPEERARHFQELVSSVSRNATAVSELETTYDYPGTRKFQVKVEHYAIKSGPSLYLDLPGVAQSVGLTDMENRTRPYYQDNQVHWDNQCHLTLPPGMRPVILPAPLTWEGPGDFGWLSLRVDASKAGEIHTAFTGHLQPSLVPTGSYDHLLEINRQLAHPSARRLLLVPKDKAE